MQTSARVSIEGTWLCALQRGREPSFCTNGTARRSFRRAVSVVAGEDYGCALTSLSLECVGNAFREVPAYADLRGLRSSARSVCASRRGGFLCWDTRTGTPRMEVPIGGRAEGEVLVLNETHACFQAGCVDRSSGIWTTELYNSSVDLFDAVSIGIAMLSAFVWLAARAVARSHRGTGGSSARKLRVSADPPSADQPWRV